MTRLFIGVSKVVKPIRTSRSNPIRSVWADPSELIHPGEGETEEAIWRSFNWNIFSVSRLPSLFSLISFPPLYFVFSFWTLSLDSSSFSTLPSFLCPISSLSFISSPFFKIFSHTYSPTFIFLSSPPSPPLPLLLSLHVLPPLLSSLLHPSDIV